MLCFLDVMIIKNEDRISDVFYKHTDTKLHLKFDSCQAGTPEKPIRRI